MLDEIYNKLKNDRYFYWLGLDAWGIEHAAWLFLDIEPDSVEDNGSEIHTLRLIGSKELICSWTRMGDIPFDDDIEKKDIEKLDKFSFVFYKYIEFLKDKNMGSNEQELLDFRASPKYWINRAYTKKIEIPWLDFVIKEGYYKPNDTELTERELTNKERETLLIIIAALAKEAKIDIAKISKAGDLIANMTQLIGAPIGATTIETHLKKINQAIANRTK